MSLVFFVHFPTLGFCVCWAISREAQIHAMEKPDQPQVLHADGWPGDPGHPGPVALGPVE